jgi:hypothetical protein
VSALTEAATQPVGAPFIIFHDVIDVIDEQTDGDLEICLPVPPEVDALHSQVEFKATRVASSRRPRTVARTPRSRPPTPP